MSKTTLTVSAVIIIALLGGAYYYFGTNASIGTPADTTPATNTTANPTGDKVEAQDVKVGEGKEALPNTVVSVLYEGRLADGTVFDSSAAHGNQPLSFTLGSQGMIPGFQIGVNGMKEGGERVISIPPSLGYGTQEVKDQSGKVIIPANSTIIFGIKLVKVEPAPATTAPQQ